MRGRRNSNLHTEAARKKRLGQYFTERRLAKLLAAISDAENAVSLIDPMSGNGNMIEACFEIGAKPNVVVGVEIDAIAHEQALKRFRNQAGKAPELILGDVFSLDTLRKFPLYAYDLVITNPPYVRYQNQSERRNGEIKLPSAKAIRKCLLEIVDFLPSLDKTDRELFRQLIQHYSGLADLAVPAWLLCAMLTREGGTLAMVVPDVWLSRDYATVIHYLLLRWFHITYIVEDDHAAWFSNALVKTNLVVARRIPRRNSAFSWKTDGFLAARLPAEAMNETSIVGHIFPEQNPEQRFAQLLSKRSISREPINEPLISVDWRPLQQEAENLKRRSSDWLDEIEGASITHDAPATADLGQVSLHPALCSWLGNISGTPFVCSESLRVNIGQGLRTGANQFFYVDLVESEGDLLKVVPASVFGATTIQVPSDCLMPVLRKQIELPGKLQIDPRRLSGRVLLLQNYVHPDDINGAPPKLKIMPAELAAFVQIAARTNVGTQNEPTYIPGMSAVKTNIKTPPRGSDLPPRFWYMLPDLTARHRPDLFIARVNNGHPKTYLNSSNRMAIDANFSTLWLEEDSPITRSALLAVLNSTWCVTAMELLGTVMGGGALKLEATHLRRLPIPGLSPAQWSRMDRIGVELSKAASPGPVIEAADQIVMSAITARGAHTLDMQGLKRIASERLSRRSKRT